MSWGTPYYIKKICFLGFFSLLRGGSVFCFAPLICWLLLGVGRCGQGLRMLLLLSCVRSCLAGWSGVFFCVPVICWGLCCGVGWLGCCGSSCCWGLIGVFVGG